MNTSVIRHRVADFLSHHAPFDSLPHAELLELTASGRVKFHESEEFIFDLGGSYGNLLWVVQQGEVELLDGRGRLLDVKGCGDVLGLERFSVAATPGPLYAAVTKTDVILYGVPAALFSALIERYPSVREFVEAHVSVADVHGFARTSWLDSPAPPIEFLQARQAGGSDDQPSVHCVITTRAIMREMVRRGVECIHVDSLRISASDLALFCGANPPTLLRYLRESRTDAERDVLQNRLNTITRDALAQPGDVDDCIALTSAVAHAWAASLIRTTPPTAEPSAWLLFGRAARGELPSGELAALAFVHHRQDQTGLAWSAGAVPWPDGFASSMTISQCIDFFSETIRNPLQVNLYARRAMFDVELAGGDPVVLEQICEHIRAELSANPATIPLLANDTLAHLPPLTFFQGVVLDWDGARRDSFNIQETAVSPIAGAARVFALAARRLDCVKTLDRLKLAEEMYPAHSAVFREAAEAFRAARYFQVLSGGSRIEPQNLSKLEQRLLKTAFTAIERLLEFTIETTLGSSGGLA